MSILSRLEAKWISHKLKIYKIKYAEVYNEIYDHIVSAIEEKRNQGDGRDILVLFQDIIDGDFGGYRGIDRLCEDRKNTVLRFMTRNLNREFFSHFRSMKLVWFVIPVILIIMLAKGLGWGAKNIIIVNYIISVVPLVYFLIHGTKNRYFRIIQSKRKPSLVNQSMFHICSLVMMLMHGIFASAPFLFSMFTGQDWVQLVHNGVEYLGIPALALLAGLGFVYAKSAVTLIHEDYDKMIREVIPATK